VEARRRRKGAGGGPGWKGVVSLLLLSAPAACARPMPPPATPVPGWTEQGVASWYGEPFHGRQTASGEVYDMEQMTAAHRTLPFGTVVRVENLDNGRHARFRINDRGPFVRGRVVDVSRRGGRELGMLGPGTARVRLVVEESPPAVADCWDVQVGSYRSARNAENRVSRMRREGLTARTEAVESGHIRVLVGPLSREEARRVERRHDGLLVACRR